MASDSVAPQQTTAITQRRRYATPRASYRVQLHRGFTFDDARALVPYLAALGISHLYCSPIFAATPGSTHGYDVTDHGQINPELGGLPGLHALGEALRERDMGLIIDMVPNHVGLANSQNPWWRDVLRHGEASRHAPTFDINWSTQPHLPSGVLVYPILGQPFGRALEAGELQLTLDDGDLALRYYDHALPLAPRTYAAIIGPLPPELRRELRDPAASVELVDLLARLEAAPPDEADRLLERFRRMVGEEPAIAAQLGATLAELNGRVGEPSSFDRLEAILARQHYRLVYWRVAGEEINYRRFFDINDLAGVRVEREEVFEATHRLLFALVAQGIVTGVRIDHIDGLYDPTRYLAQLRAGLREAARGLTDQELPIYVEKILELDEALPSSWPVTGTTGYDFLAHSDGLLVDRGSVVETTRTYERFVGEPVRFRQLRYDAKRQIARTAFTGEISVLANQLHMIAQGARRHRDTTLGALRRAIETTLATFPIYRTYVTDDTSDSGATAEDRATIEAALTEARRRDQTLVPEALDFLAEVLLLDGPEPGTPLPPVDYERRLHFRRRFQQLSSPVMAKGFEDTTFYRYNRLLSLNEVGNDPSRFGINPDEAHAWFAERAEHWPGAMSASSTHDTKRSEDARARLHVISEQPGHWADEVRRWSELNARHRTVVAGEAVPDRTTEYLIYQNLIASWPTGADPLDGAYRERLHGYLTKAMREMKVYTSWTDPDEQVEAAAGAFLMALLHPRQGRAFQRRVSRFVAALEPSASLNGLATLLLKATAPGFPDFYQGTELWDRSLTDPDNRRPVDYAARRALLDELGDAPPDDLRAGAMKLWLTRRLLALRERKAVLFTQGDYQPVVASGAAAAHIFAFARSLGDDNIVVAVPRLTTRLTTPGSDPPLGQAWGDTTLALPATGRRWRNALTGATYEVTEGQLECAELFAALPFAVLVGEAQGRSNERPGIPG